MNHQEIHDLTSILDQRLHEKIIAICNGEKISQASIRRVINETIKEFVFNEDSDRG